MNTFDRTYLHTELELTECLDKVHALDVAYGAAKLYDAHLRFDVALDRLLGHPFHPLLDRVRDMGHHCKQRGNGQVRFAEVDRCLSSHSP